MPDPPVPDAPVASQHPRHPFAAASGCQWTRRESTRAHVGSGPYVNDQREQTTGGALGKLAGKAKAAAGSALGDDQLAREGRLQEAQSDAETEAAREREQARQAEAEAQATERRAEVDAERERLRNELRAEEREAAIERDRSRAEAAAEQEAAREEAAAEADRRAGELAASAEERAAARLEQRARAIDPEEGG